MGFAENLGVIVNMKDPHSSVEAEYEKWLAEKAENRVFAQSVPRTSALQHAGQLSTVERSFVAKYPGDSGVTIRALCKEIVTRLAAAGAAPAASPPIDRSAPPAEFKAS
jgi:chromosome partitioning protein